MPDEQDPLELFRDWYARACGAFLRGYAAVVDGSTLHGGPLEETAPLIELFVIQKGLYEVRYELDNRPTWVALPIAGVLEALDASVAVSATIAD